MQAHLDLNPGAEPQDAPAPHNRQPAQPRDRLRPLTVVTLLVSVGAFANLLLPLLSVSATIWLQALLLLALWSLTERLRGQHRPLRAWTVAMLPLGIGQLLLLGSVPFSAAWMLSTGLAGLILLGVTWISWMVFDSQPSAPLVKPPTRLSDFRMLMKFRIISLLLLTTLIPMYLVNGTWPPLLIILATLLGGTLAAGGANAFNMYMDRDIDMVMTRTKRRPLPGNRLSSREVLAFALVLSVLSFVLMTTLVNLTSALLAQAGIFYYVVIYTRWLKRTTVQNIVIGGAAGAIPPLVGWAAASPESWLPAVFLFVIVFYWTPPHFWALAIVRREDYARAGIPMLPVVRGEAETRRQIVLYTFMMIAITLMLVALHTVGWVYLIAALILNGLFLFYAVRMLVDTSHAAAWRLYKYSLLYLALLFVAMGVDRAILG